MNNAIVVNTLDGLTTFSTSGGTVDPALYVKYSGNTSDTDLGSYNITTTHVATASADLVNLQVLTDSNTYLLNLIGTNYLNKVTATAQTVNPDTTFTNKIISTPATAGTVAIFDGSKTLSSSSVTSTELGYLSGVTSGIQAQLNGKLNLSGGLMTGTLSMSGSNRIIQSYNATTSDTTTLVNRQTLDSAIAGIGSILTTNNTFTGTNNFDGSLFQVLNDSIYSIRETQSLSASPWTATSGTITSAGSIYTISGGPYGGTATLAYTFGTTATLYRFTISASGSLGGSTLTLVQNGVTLYTSANFGPTPTYTTFSAYFRPPYGSSYPVYWVFTSPALGGTVSWQNFSLERIQTTVNAGIGTMTIETTPTTATSVTNKAYVDSAISGSLQWTTSGSNIYNANSGNVGIGTNVFPALFNVYGTSLFGQNGAMFNRITAGYGVSLPTTNLIYIGQNPSDKDFNVATSYVMRYSNANTSTTADGYFSIANFKATAYTGGLVGTTGTFTDVLAIKGSNVGIGTVNPTATLEIIGSSAVIKGTNPGTVSNYIQLSSNASAYLFAGMDNASGNGLFGTGVAYGGGLGTVHSAPLALATTNAIRMTITAGGNVGIGTTNPTSKVNIYSTDSTGPAMTLDGTVVNTSVPLPILKLGKDLYNGAGDYYAVGYGYCPGQTDYSPAEIGLVTQSIASYTYGDLVFRVRQVTTNTRAPERMRILNDGTVGIGTNTTSSILQLAKAISTNNNYGLMLNFQNTQAGYYDWSIGPYIDAGQAMFALRGDGDGFGALRNIYKWTTDSNFQLYGQASTGGGKVEFYQPDGTRLMYLGCPNSVSSTAYLQVVATRHLSIGTNDAERIWIKSNGKIALGMDGQTVGLASGHINLVVGQGAWNNPWNDGANVVITGDPIATNAYGMGLGQNFANGYSYINSLQSGIAWQQLVIAASYTSICFNGTQCAYSTAGGWVNTSDRRCKHEIQDIKTSRSLERILQCRPKRYKRVYPENPAIPVSDEIKNQICIGLIAQEVQEYNPHAVSEWDDRDATEESEKKKLGVNYNDFVIHLIGAVQELHKRNEQLEQELADYKTATDKKLDKLASLVAQLMK